MTTSADFYHVPGKSHEPAATVSAKKKKDGMMVDAIYIGSVDVFRFDDEWAAEKVRSAVTNADDCVIGCAQAIRIRKCGCLAPSNTAESTIDLPPPRLWGEADLEQPRRQVQLLECPAW